MALHSLVLTIFGLLLVSPTQHLVSAIPRPEGHTATVLTSTTPQTVSSTANQQTGTKLFPESINSTYSTPVAVSTTFDSKPVTGILEEPKTPQEAAEITSSKPVTDNILEESKTPQKADEISSSKPVTDHILEESKTPQKAEEITNSKPVTDHILEESKTSQEAEEITSSKPVTDHILEESKTPQEAEEVTSSKPVTLSQELTTEVQHVSTQNPLEVKKKLSLYSVVQSNTEFAIQLYQAVREKEENVLVSPLSVGAALSMVWLGAAGETAAQIQKALHLPTDQDKVAEGYHELFHTLEDTGKNNITLALATKMYVHDIFLLRENFQSLVVQSFYSEVEKVDFMKKSEEIRVSINKWVENKTHDKIKDLMPEGVVNMDTRVVMVNAMYFKGLWKIPFEAEFTRDLPFHLANGSIVNVSTMVASGEFPITQVPHLNCTLLSLPYQGSTSLLVLFPEKPDALPVLEKHFSLLDLENITSKLENIDMHLLFPKFTMEFSSELEEPLRSLGINAMFDSEADFSGITPIKGLSVNHVIHKTFLKITEEGSEASASTAIDLDIRGGTFSLNVNHPFLFVIRDDKTGSVLFLGNYQGPK